MLAQLAGHIRTARCGVYPQNEDKGEEHNRLEGYASQPRHGGAVYFPVVRHVKEFLRNAMRRICGMTMPAQNTHSRKTATQFTIHKSITFLYLFNEWQKCLLVLLCHFPCAARRGSGTDRCVFRVVLPVLCTQGLPLRRPRRTQAVPL